MPRGPRVDAPSAVHHVMLRGIERRRIFRDAGDYEEFLRRLDRLIPELGFRCFAWALMPNHVHLALRTGPVPLPRLMARLGTGYARYFNRRHGRVGHLLQNRYKSRLVADDQDLLGLVLYIHGNPLRAGLVAAAVQLERYPWCGHGALTGRRPARPFEATRVTLALFGNDRTEARRRLRRDLEAPEPEDRRPTFDRPAPGASDPDPTPRDAPSLEQLLHSVCAAYGLPLEALGRGRRSRRVTAARAEIAHRAIRDLGLPGHSVAQALDVSDATISRALARTPKPRRADA